jgi:hypothetical protein
VEGLGEQNRLYESLIIKNGGRISRSSSSTYWPPTPVSWSPSLGNSSNPPDSNRRTAVRGTCPARRGQFAKNSPVPLHAKSRPVPGHRVLPRPFAHSDSCTALSGISDSSRADAAALSPPRTGRKTPAERSRIQGSLGRRNGACVTRRPDAFRRLDCVGACGCGHGPFVWVPRLEPTNRRTESWPPDTLLGFASV